MVRLFITFWFLIPTSGNANADELIWMANSRDIAQCRPTQSRQTVSALFLETELSLRALFEKSHISSRVNHGFVGLFWTGVWDMSRAPNSVMEHSKSCVSRGEL